MMTENDKISTLTKEVEVWKEKCTQLVEDKDTVERMWKGETGSLEDVYREAEIAKQQVITELSELSAARKKLEKEQKAVASLRAQLEASRSLAAGNTATQTLQSRETVLPGNAEKVMLFLDAVMTETAQGIVRAVKGEDREGSSGEFSEKLKREIKGKGGKVSAEVQMLRRLLESLRDSQTQHVQELESNEAHQSRLLTRQLHSPSHSLSSTLRRSPPVSSFPSLLSTARKENRSVSPVPASDKNSVKNRLMELSARVAHSQSTPKFDKSADNLKPFARETDRMQVLNTRKDEFQQFIERGRAGKP